MKKMLLCVSLVSVLVLGSGCASVTKPFISTPDHPIKLSNGFHMPYSMRVAFPTGPTPTYGYGPFND